MQGTKSYIIDITRTRGKGEFRCPKCGIQISPDDKTDKVYTVLETVMSEDYLEKIILQCNSCKSQIHLIGFKVLNKLM